MQVRAPQRREVHIIMQLVCSHLMCRVLQIDKFTATLLHDWRTPNALNAASRRRAAPSPTSPLEPLGEGHEAAAERMCSSTKGASPARSICRVVSTGNGPARRGSQSFRMRRAIHTSSRARNKASAQAREWSSAVSLVCSTCVGASHEVPGPPQRQRFTVQPLQTRRAIPSTGEFLPESIQDPSTIQKGRRGSAERNG